MDWLPASLATVVVVGAVAAVWWLRRLDARRLEEREHLVRDRLDREAAMRRAELDGELARLRVSFIEAVSHELRTPLAVVLGFALTLENTWGAIDEAQAREYVGRLSRGAQRLDQLLSDLMDVRRLKMGLCEAHIRPIELGHLTRETVAATESPSHDVILDVHDMRILVDPAMFERALEIMIANARKHTPAGSKIWVRLRPDGHGALLSVHDEGAGVPDEKIDTIFEPFEQYHAHNESPGTGVGLALVAGYARLHGGLAWVENRDGRGATFKIAFPGTYVSSEDFSLTESRPPVAAEPEPGLVTAANQDDEPV